jgi:glyoxylase-like metal-dependent hydrolase (beta-lactamase superfamily II)
VGPDFRICKIKPLRFCSGTLNVHIIDTLQLDRPGVVAAVAMETNDGVALFDTGPESTFKNVSSVLNALGIRPTDVRHVFLSHIHFDHAGAAFRFAESGATIYVHPRGAPHLIDPTKLVESATRIFGDNMQKLWGRIAPVPQHQVQVANDGDIIQVGQIKVKAIETPGHASHHHVYHWDDTIFGGDIAGVRLGQGPPIPPFVPPELQIEAWLESIDKMRALDARMLYLPHFGLVPGALSKHFDALEQRVRQWSIWFREKIRAQSGEQQLIKDFAAYEHADLRSGGASEAEVESYEAADPSYMAVPAASRYWKKYHPEAIQG